MKSKVLGANPKRKLEVKRDRIVRKLIELDNTIEVFDLFESA